MPRFPERDLALWVMKRLLVVGVPAAPMEDMMADFADRLAALVSKEASAASRDPERMGAMIERLACALGFTAALAAGGDGPTIDRLLSGAEGYAHEEAVSKAPIAKFMRSMRGQPPSPATGG